MLNPNINIHCVEATASRGGGCYRFPLSPNLSTRPKRERHNRKYAECIFARRAHKPHTKRSGCVSPNLPLTPTHVITEWQRERISVCGRMVQATRFCMCGEASHARSFVLCALFSNRREHTGDWSVLRWAGHQIARSVQKNKSIIFLLQNKR